MKQDIPFTDAELRALGQRVQKGQEPPESLDLLTAAEASRLELLMSPPGMSAADPRPDWQQVPLDLAKGIAQSVPKAIIGAGKLVHQIPGVSQGIDALYGALGGPGMDSRAMMDQAAADPALQADTGAMKAGQFLGDAAMFAASPSGKVKAVQAAPKLVRGGVEMARQALGSGAIGAAQGGDVKAGVPAAAFGAAAVPVAGAAKATAQWLGDRAVPLVRSGIKPLWSDLSKQAGASTVGQEKLADRLAKFIIDNGITDSAKAERIVLEAENTIQGMVGAQVTDAPERAGRYLAKLRASAARQGLPEGDVAIITRAARELLRGRHGYTAVKTFQPSGAVTTTRLPRQDMTAAEALDTARQSGRWGNRKSWGEQKGAAMEASKTVERADRDAVKATVKGSAPVFNRQGQAIQAKKVFTRGEFRQANRDSLGMPTVLAGAAELAAGKPPFMAMAAEFVRRNQVRMGVWADRLSTAIQRNDVETAAAILRKFGVGAASQAFEPDQQE